MGALAGRRVGRASNTRSTATLARVMIPRITGAALGAVEASVHRTEFSEENESAVRVFQHARSGAQELVSARVRCNELGSRDRNSARCCGAFLFVPGLKERPWTASRIAGAIVAVLGYVLVVTARVQLGKSFSIGPRQENLLLPVSIRESAIPCTSFLISC